MANEKKKPDLNSKNPTSSKPDPNTSKNSPGSNTNKPNSDFGGPSRNSGSDMNKEKDMNKPGRGGFEASDRDLDRDRSEGSSTTENEVSGGSSPSSGRSRNH